ncbi:MAG: tRNA (adenosine(37)-N6)-dimethylallyltransferase MiaA [Treponema sp.]|nr:tRNA (adenosine(37)-N6)-dimethylallyltransferase MiaA [Treponema sp.]
MEETYNTVVLLGPTAVGKTALGVRIARKFGWDIISADSRQVYRGLDIGSGKDLADYTIREKSPDGSEIEVRIPYHLIDVATLDGEYNVFHFQDAFYRLFRQMQSDGKTPFVVGGTGMYVDSIVRGYDFVPVPENEELRAELEKKSLEELDEMLLSLKPDLHNKSDLVLRERVVRAIEIALFMKSPECVEAREKMESRPEIKPLVIGTTLERSEMHKNIKIRLDQRMQEGMIEEVRGLHESGYSWERLEKLGLEYRFISLYLEGRMNLEECSERLYHAICQFAKRQETWFRGMEKKGVKIHWLPRENDREAKFEFALSVLEDAGFSPVR